MGRPRKPTELKILDGDRKDRINREEPKSPAGLGDPPEWLDKIGREAWSRLSDRLDEMGVATRADSEGVAIYCQAFSTVRQAMKRIAEDGTTIETETTVKAHPLWTIVHEGQRTMLRVLTQLGMTPSSRAGLHVAEKPEANALLAYIRDGKSRTGDGKRGG